MHVNFKSSCGGSGFVLKKVFYMNAGDLFLDGGIQKEVKECWSKQTKLGEVVLIVTTDDNYYIKRQSVANPNTIQIYSYSGFQSAYNSYKNIK